MAPPLLGRSRSAASGHEVYRRGGTAAMPYISHCTWVRTADYSGLVYGAESSPNYTRRTHNPAALPPRSYLYLHKWPIFSFLSPPLSLSLSLSLAPYQQLMKQSASQVSS